MPNKASLSPPCWNTFPSTQQLYYFSNEDLNFWTHCFLNSLKYKLSADIPQKIPDYLHLSEAKFLLSIRSSEIMQTIYSNSFPEYIPKYLILDAQSNPQHWIITYSQFVLPLSISSSIKPLLMIFPTKIKDLFLLTIINMTRMKENKITIYFIKHIWSIEMERKEYSRKVYQTRQ